MSAGQAEQAAPEQATPDQLAWEAARRRTVGLVAAVAALLTLLGGVLLVVNVAPPYTERAITLVEALELNAEGRGETPGASGSRLRWVAERPAAALGPAVLTGLAALLMFPPLAFLFRATRHRRPMRQTALVLAAIGAVGFGVGTIVTFALYYDAIPRSGDLSNSAVADAITGSSAISTAGTIRALGALALGAATILIALNAMRAGLLPRFLGVLGVIVGGALLLTGTPLPLDQQGLIRTFWLAALAFLLIGRLPGGLPPAWTSGRAEPWPSGRPAPAPLPPKGRREPRPAPAEAEPDVPAPEPRAPHPSSKKRRKRRR